VATASNEADEIRRQMAQIRRELHQDVRGVVVQAEAVADWRRYIRMYPLASLGMAFAIGYLVVPRRYAERAGVREAVVPPTGKPADRSPTRTGVVSSVLGMVAPVAVRVAQGYAVHYLENWIARQQSPTMAGPAGQPARSPSGPERI
jgi:hypothetical protein